MAAFASVTCVALTNAAIVVETTSVATPLAFVVAMSIRLPTSAAVNAAEADENAVDPDVVTPSLTILVFPFAPKYLALTGRLAGSAAGKSIHTWVVPAARLTTAPPLLDASTVVRDSVFALALYVPMPISQFPLGTPVPVTACSP
ncbi:hypothetical protein WL90_27440 [Burkholderia cenocepacia]|nr:hypothetical protein WL90_27440 [Burkholderia cenocepacia]KWF58851.1 hypothetical protein WL89_18185 [Burkholderia cenocepacia]